MGLNSLSKVVKYQASLSGSQNTSNHVIHDKKYLKTFGKFSCFFFDHQDEQKDLLESMETLLDKISDSLSTTLTEDQPALVIDSEVVCLGMARQSADGPSIPIESRFGGVKMDNGGAGNGDLNIQVRQLYLAEVSIVHTSPCNKMSRIFIPQCIVFESLNLKNLCDE